MDMDDFKGVYQLGLALSTRWRWSSLSEGLVFLSCALPLFQGLYPLSNPQNTPFLLVFPEREEMVVNALDV